MASNAKNLAEYLNNQTTSATADIADGSITTVKLAADAVTAAKLADNAVVSANLSAGTLEGSGVNLGSRNMIINGDFKIAQRGTSSTSSGMQTVDRTHLIFSGTDEAPTQAQVDVASGTTPYSLGFRKAFRVTNGNQTSGAGAADYIQYEQGIEASRIYSYGWDSTSASSNITMSFWVKSSVATTFLGSLRATDSAKIYNWDTGALSANTWTKVTKTIPGASGVTINNDNGLGLQWLLWPYLGTNYTGGGTPNAWKAHDSNDWGASAASTSWYTTNDATFEITGLQIEVGSSATDFEKRSFAEELQLCKRYFQNIGADGSQYAGFNYNDLPMFSCPFPVEMRVAPTGSVQGTGSAFSSTNATGQTNYTGSTTSNLNLYTKSNRNYLTGGSWSGSGNDRGNALLGNQNVNLDAEL